MAVDTKRLVIDTLRAGGLRSCAASIVLLAAFQVHAAPGTGAAAQSRETRDIINTQGITPSNDAVDDANAPQVADVRDLGFVLRGVQVEGASGQSQLAIEHAFPR